MPASRTSPAHTIALYFAVFGTLLLSVATFAHDVSPGDVARIARNGGEQFSLFAFLGAKHMVTGIDHVLFLLGVMFYLDRLRNVLIYATLFAVGHTITLISGVLTELSVNAHLVDAIIGLSVAYKGFDNLGGFDRLFGQRPVETIAVFVFGLFHGLGLASKIQDLGLPDDGLVTNLIAFNLGVEGGQIAALFVIVVALKLLGSWRHAKWFGASINTALIAAGIALMTFQLGRFAGY
ncbi:MAG: HupE/UreJ family protein [Gammaproteobacteria bacterium]